MKFNADFKLMAGTLAAMVLIAVQAAPPPVAPDELDLAALEKGADAPTVADGVAVFAPEAEASQALLSRENYDLTRGCRIALEFMVDGDQNNPYARIIELNGFSLQFHNQQGSLIKVYAPQADGKHAQVVVRCPVKPGEWRQAEIFFDAEANEIGISIDGAAPRTVAAGLRPATAKAKMVLGAPGAASSNRGFTGKIRRVRISAATVDQPGN